jgi:archaemetzincin
MGPPAYIYVRWIGIGKPQRGLLEDAMTHVEDVFGVPVRVMPRAEAPPALFDPVRGQYSSTKMLRRVLEDVPPDARKVIAVTDCDLFIPVLTFVFGEAQLGGIAAVVSTARLRLDQRGNPCAPDTLQARLRKECVHELGHAFGLEHCPLMRCAMSRSNTVPEVDSKSWHLCRECRGRLRIDAAAHRSDGHES